MPGKIELEDNGQKFITINSGHLKLIHPFGMIVAGGSGSGKSHTIFDILDNLKDITVPKIEKVVFIYGIYQQIYKKYPNVFFTDKLEFLSIKPKIPTLIVVDDLMSKISNDFSMEEFFTQRVHHDQISICLVLQNLFYQGKVMKTIRDNAQYFIITHHSQDVRKMSLFGQQLEKKGSKYFTEAYEDATGKKYGYLFIDCHPASGLRESEHKIKYRTNIHKSHLQTLYIPK